jgi:alkanesulfonate monooxygenase SsuD/methylene tetrahydromethanopterin reductase-like flavin-dependent oxidoreductase (luciferase family)
LRLGLILPHFRREAGPALRLAQEAERAGIDGVFCYDHLWPMGQPERPALSPFPLLGAVAASTRTIHIGTLVARIGLVADETLVAQFVALSELAAGRVIAGVGIGDHKSEAEDEAYGLPKTSPGERRRRLEACSVELSRRSIPVWIGGSSPALLEMAARVGAAVNLWDVPAAGVAARANRAEVTWAGPPPVALGPHGAVGAGSSTRQEGEPSADGAAERPAEPLPEPLPEIPPPGAEGTGGGRVQAATDPHVLGALLAGLAAAGATWAVLGPPPPLEMLVEARAGSG